MGKNLFKTTRLCTEELINQNRRAGWIKHSVLRVGRDLEAMIDGNRSRILTLHLDVPDLMASLNIGRTSIPAFVSEISKTNALLSFHCCLGLRTPHFPSRFATIITLSKVL